MGGMIKKFRKAQLKTHKIKYENHNIINVSTKDRRSVLDQQF